MKKSVLFSSVVAPGQSAAILHLRDQQRRNPQAPRFRQLYPGLRISNFGVPSDFGLRTSDLHLRRWLFLIAIPLLLVVNAGLASSAVLISEFMAINNTTLKDEDGSY